MASDETNKSKLAKLLQNIEVPEVKLTERCSEMVKKFHQMYDQEVEEGEKCDGFEVYENPYKCDQHLLQENERKLKELLSQSKRFEIGSGQYIPRPTTKKCFLRSLGELRNLRLLALEYSHIADGTGGALMSLLPVIKKPHFQLQLLCRENQTPGRADAALGIGGYGIPDTAWRRVMVHCPDLYILMAFYCIRDYDNVRRFLTPSIQLREAHLQLGIDLKMRQRQDSDISCFVRHLAHFYGNNLVTLSIHQWRFANFPLRRVFALMPHLARFFYVGKVEDEIDLRIMLQIIVCGVCEKLKQVKIQIQDDEARRDYWSKVTKSLADEYKEIIKFCNIDFCVSIYKN